MLTIRLSRVGKRNSPSFRVVVQEKSDAPQGDYVDKVGYYNSRKGKLDLEDDKVEQWLDNGAQPSSTVHNLFVDEGFIEGEKKQATVGEQKRKEEEEMKEEEEETSEEEEETKEDEAEEPEEEKNEEDEKQAEEQEETAEEEEESESEQESDEDQSEKEEEESEEDDESEQELEENEKEEDEEAETDKD